MIRIDIAVPKVYSLAHDGVRYIAFAANYNRHGSATKYIVHLDQAGDDHILHEIKTAVPFKPAEYVLAGRLEPNDLSRPPSAGTFLRPTNCLSQHGIYSVRQDGSVKATALDNADYHFDPAQARWAFGDLGTFLYVGRIPHDPMLRHSSTFLPPAHRQAVVAAGPDELVVSVDWRLATMKLPGAKMLYSPVIAPDRLTAAVTDIVAGAVYIVDLQ